MKGKYHCVLTLDLIDSRHLPNRDLVQEELKNVLSLVNDKFRESISVPFDFTLGDEIQGVLANLPASYLLILEFQKLLQDYHFYTGVGYGEITTKLGKRSSEMDGPAFYLARECIEKLKEEYHRKHAKVFINLIRYNLQDCKQNQIINNYLQMVELLKFKLSEKQRQVYILLQETSTYREIAQLLNQSKSAITQKIQGGHIEEIRRGEEGVVELLTWVEQQNSR